MANTGIKGIDIRQTTSKIVFRAFLLDAAGALVTSGTASLYIYEIQDDGTFASYDFSSNTFKTSALTTETASMTHRLGNNATTNTGIWTYSLSTLSGFTLGAVYIAKVVHSGAIPAGGQAREFMFGGAEGNVTLIAESADVLAVKAKTDNLPTDPADASDIASSFSTVNSTLATLASYVDTEVAAIKAKTDNLPTDPADASDIAAAFATVNSTLATLTTYVDTEVAAIKAKTDNLPSDPADQSAVEAAIIAAAMTAAGIRAAIGMAFADLDAQLTALSADIQQIDVQVDNVYLDTNTTIPGLITTVDTVVDAIKLKTDNLPAAPAAVGDIPTAAQVATRVLDTEEMETGYSFRKAMRLFLSLFGGKSSGFPTSPVFRDVNDTKDRLSATMDGDNNRTAVTIDVT